MGKQIIFLNSSESRLSDGSCFVDTGEVLESQLKSGHMRVGAIRDVGDRIRDFKWHYMYTAPTSNNVRTSSWASWLTIGGRGWQSHHYLMILIPAWLFLTNQRNHFGLMEVLIMQTCVQVVWNAFRIWIICEYTWAIANLIMHGTCSRCYRKA